MDQKFSTAEINTIIVPDILAAWLFTETRR